MIGNNEYARYAYETGFAHGLDLSIDPPSGCDHFYRLGFVAARASE